MHKLVGYLYVIAAATAAAGCAKDEAKAAAPGPLVGKLEALAERACACTDAACADGVGAEVVTLGENAGAIAESDLPALQAAQAKIDRCLSAHEPALVAYTELTDEVCACKDRTCAEKVAKKVSAWAADLKRSKRTLRPGDARLVMAEQGKRGAACFERHGVAIPQ